MRCRLPGLTLLLSTTMLVQVAVAQQLPVRPADDIIAPGQILFHRTEAAISPQTEASWEERLQHKIAEAQQSLLTATESQLGRMRDENSRLQQQLTAQQMLMTEAAKAREEATQARLQTVAATTDTRLGAQEQTLQSKLAVIDAKTSAADEKYRQLAEAAQAKIEAIADSTQARLAAAERASAAERHATDTKLAALADTTDARLAANERVADARIAAVENTTDAKVAMVAQKAQAQADEAARVAELQGRFTDYRLAAAEQATSAKLAGMADIAEKQNQLSEARLAALDAKTNAQVVALADDFQKKLHFYATEQLAQTRAQTGAALQTIAKNARLDVLELQGQTAQKLAEIRDAADKRAAVLAGARAAEVEKKLSAALEQRTSPEQVRQLAREQLADAAPEMRALALQTLSDSQDYIKTVAKDAVKENDPAVQEALQKAARNVITKDNKVVFAMRQAMARQIAAEAAGKPLPGTTDDTPAGAMGGTTAEGTPSMAMGKPLGDDVQIDPAGLQITAPAAGPSATVPQVLASLGGQNTSLLPARNRRDWVDLRKYRVVVHEDGKTLEELLDTVMKRAEPFTGPWKIKWKIHDENKDILTAKFSLDTETSFEEFVGYLAQYLVNDRGVKVTFSLFDRDRILVVSD